MKRFIFVVVLSIAMLGPTGAGWAGPVSPPGSCYDICLDVYDDCVSGVCGPVSRFECYDYYETCFDCCAQSGLPCAAC